MIRAVIADDHTIFRQGLKGLLASSGDIAVEGEADNGQDAYRLINELKPDVAVLDVSMPRIDGLQVSAEVRRKGLATKIIILTMNNDAVNARKAIDSGVSGFVLKDNAFEDLLYAIRAAVSGGTFISPLMAGKLLDNVTNNQSGLSERETEVLKLIASGLTNKQIGERLFISIKTVETYRTRLMQKLDIHNTADLVRYAIKEDLV